MHFLGDKCLTNVAQCSYNDNRYPEHPKSCQADLHVLPYFQHRTLLTRVNFLEPSFPLLVPPTFLPLVLTILFHPYTFHAFSVLPPFLSSSILPTLPWNFLSTFFPLVLHSYLFFLVPPTCLPSFPKTFQLSFLLFVISTFLHSLGHFQPSFLPSFGPLNLPTNLSVLSKFLPSLYPFNLPSFPWSFQPSFLPLVLSSFLSCFNSY